MISDLMRFRTAYLRIVADYWKRGHLPPRPSRHDHDNQAFKTHGMDWRNWNALKVTLDAGNGPIWNPQSGDWYKDGNPSELTVFLPLDPPNRSAASWPEALAEFYIERKTIFGAGRDTSMIGATDAAAGAAQNGPRATQDAHNQGNRPMGLGGWDEFLEFGALLIRVVALAWADEDFRYKVQGIPKPRKGGRSVKKAGGPGKVNANDALRGYFGFNSSWNMDIVVAHDEHARYEHGKWVWGAGRGATPNRLVLTVPQKPPRAVKAAFVPVVLTAYNNTGPQHPFSCCN